MRRRNAITLGDITLTIMMGLVVIFTHNQPLMVVIASAMGILAIGIQIYSYRSATEDSLHALLSTSTTTLYAVILALLLFGLEFL